MKADPQDTFALHSCSCPPNSELKHRKVGKVPSCKWFGLLSAKLTTSWQYGTGPLPASVFKKLYPESLMLLSIPVNNGLQYYSGFTC